MKAALNLNRDSVQIEHYPSLKSIRSLAKDEFSRLDHGGNSLNALRRGIRWGIYLNEEFHWTSRNTYQLDSSFNKEESGNVRTFTLISDSFVNNDVIKEVLAKKFDTWRFKQSSSVRAYEVQLSLIGYEATLAASALPSPVYAHQDMVDGSVAVLYIGGDLEGGVTRVFDLNNRMLAEASLEEGDAMFMVDSKTKHVVTPISVKLGSVSGFAERLLMIVRFQPLGR